MRILLIISFFLQATFSFSQNNEENYKHYKVYPTLSWNDFLVRPVAEFDNKFSASVSTGLDFKWDYNIENAQQNFSYKVRARLYPASSWVFEHKRDSALLVHEQLHYDITELYARKLRKIISEYKLGRNIRKDLKAIYQDVEASRQEMQAVYDKESGHSKNKEQQQIWNKKVDSLLQAYQTYK